LYRNGATVRRPLALDKVRHRHDDLIAPMRQ
jgi:hypothetical protein